MKALQIISFAQSLARELGTNNPFEIADRYGIRVLIRPPIRGFKAQTVKIEGYPTLIAINERYTRTERAKRVLCAHELGHALLHQNYTVNHFDTLTTDNMRSDVEYEANLFAVALLLEGREKELAMSLEKMSNSMLKALLDYNLLE